MINYIELGGENRPILFGTGVFRTLKKDTGLTTTEVATLVGNMDADMVCTATHLALLHGYTADKRIPDKDVTIDNVALWIDMSPKGTLRNIVRWFIDSINEFNVSEQESEEEAAPAENTKKRKAAST